MYGEYVCLLIYRFCIEPLLFRYTHSPRHIIISTDAVVEVPPGKEGKAGENFSVQADPVYFSASPIVSYKIYARQHLIGNIWRSVLGEFMHSLNKKGPVNLLHQPINFIEEYKSMENDFFKLRKTLDFIPLYQSLQEQILNYSASLSHTTNEKKFIRQEK